MVQSQESASTRDSRLKIGQVADRAGVSVDTVRLYERRGILLTPARTASGYRLYAHSAVDRIVLTRNLRDLGMTLAEIAAALGGFVAGGDCSTQRWRLERVRDRIQERLTQLDETRQELDRVISSCQRGACHIHVADDADSGPTIKDVSTVGPS